MDDCSRHALVLSKTGRAIGCARLTPQGNIERSAVLPHEQRSQIEAAMIEALNDYARETKLVKKAATKTKPKTQAGRLASCIVFWDLLRFPKLATTHETCYLVIPAKAGIQRV
jgi:hypothetical protein